MPVNKNQFLRQEILAGILMRNQLNRKDLKEVLNEKLAMRDLGPVHEKTVYNDLKELERQGAVIHFPCRGDNRYYFEERFNPDGNQLTGEELDTLENALQILRGLAVFNVSKDVADVLLRLKATRGNIDVNSPSFISFEDHTLSEGTEWMDDLVEAIRSKTPLEIEYQPFYKETSTFAFHPWFLKEYRNRWFVFGLREDQDLLVVLALDRIHRLKPVMDASWHENDRFDPAVFFYSMIGVSLPTNAQPEKITLWVSRRSAMHVETKKIHHSQRLLAKNADGSIDVELTVVVNYELISTLLGFGAAVKVLGPEGVVKKVKRILAEAIAQYPVD